MNIFSNEIDCGFIPHQDLVRKASIAYERKDAMKHFIIVRKDRDEQIVNFIENTLGFYIFHSEIFYTPPCSTRPIHVDGDVGVEPYTKIYKINWIYGGKDSKMVWYEPVKGYQPEKNLTHAGTYSLSYDPNLCKPVYSATIKNCALIEAGSPHTVINFDEPRWAVSYVISASPATDWLVSPDWDTIKTAFSKFII